MSGTEKPRHTDRIGRERVRVQVLVRVSRDVGIQVTADAVLAVGARLLLQVRRMLLQVRQIGRRGESEESVRWTGVHLEPGLHAGRKGWRVVESGWRSHGGSDGGCDG